MLKSSGEIGAAVVYTLPIPPTFFFNVEIFFGALNDGAMILMSSMSNSGCDRPSVLARVLRIPGGVNHKLGGSTRAEVIAVNDTRYAPGDFTAYIQSEAAPQASRSAESAEKFTGTTGEAARIFEKCAFLRHCRDNAATLPEPFWYALISNIALCADGKEQCHACSRAYPGYSVAETDAKITHAVAAAKRFAFDKHYAFLLALKSASITLSWGLLPS